MSQFVARALVFTSSAAVLVLEILAGRLMAPYVGVSLETFTGIIGTVLAAIALGSWAGGRLADRQDPAPLIGRAFILGGLLALLAPTLTAILGAGLRGGGAVAVVVLTAVAFFAPSAVLSAVSPLVVKLRLASLDETGEVVGSLSAVGTAGALVGTFVTGFVLLATLPTRPVVLAVGVVLVAIGVWQTLQFRQGDGGIGAQAESGTDTDTDPDSDADTGPDADSGTDYGLSRMIGGAGLAAIALILVPGPCEWETTYSCANVTLDPDNASGRTLQLDVLSHSYVDLDDPTNLRFRYIREFVAVIEATAPEGPLTTLGIGGGGFTMPRYFAATRPGSVNTVFEIDDALVDIAESELGLDTDEANLTVVASDARLALARLDSEGDGESGSEDSLTQPFDVVVGDAFAGLSVPWHLTTLEFLETLKRSMTPEGVYVMNIIDFPEFRFLWAEVNTLQQVFDNVAIMAPLDDAGQLLGGNVVVLATDGSIDADAVVSNLQDRDSDSMVIMGAELAQLVGDAPTLTDDFAPVDQMIDVPLG